MSQRSSLTRRPRSLRAPAGLPPMAKNSLALGLTTAMLMPLAAVAQAQPEAAGDAAKSVDALPEVRVKTRAADANPNAQSGVPYKARTSGDERHTRPLAETPQTISVITKTAIEESGFTDLKQILDAQPGITLGTGENGNAFGDRYIIRGQEARSDVFVDGLRDPGMTTRESFAIEQLEISKGPSSSFAGRGTAGGAINAITKQATLNYDFNKAAFGLGTDNYVRGTLDLNKIFTDQFALRANVLYADEDVPDRAPASRERKGIALSGLIEATKELSIVLDYYGMRAKDHPDLGSYLVGTLPNRKPAKNVPVYAQDPDFQESDVDTFTARVNYRFNPTVKLTNLTRYGTSDNGYVVTGARSAVTHSSNPGGVYSTATLSNHQAWQEVEYFANQTNLIWNAILGGMKHDFIFGLEYSDHKVQKGAYSVTTSGQNCKTSATASSFCIYGADGSVVSGLNNLMHKQISRGAWNADWQVKTLSTYAMDTVDLNERWSLFGGLRADNFDFDLTTTTGATAGTYGYSDTLLNGHLGVTYKINPQGMVYASFATAADINGGESDVGTSSAYGGLVVNSGAVAADPERSQSFEIGTKWNLFEESLLATAAIFQIDKSDVTEGAPGYTATGTFNSGANRVRGIEFGLAGNLTSKLSGQVGLTFMNAEIRKSYSAVNVGKTLSNFADNSADVQLKYQFTRAFSFGGAVRYESERYAGQPDTAPNMSNGQYGQPIPEYTVFDLFATYRFNKSLEGRLNIQNVGDKDYYLAGYQSGSFLYKGDARAVRLTMEYNF